MQLSLSPTPWQRKLLEDTTSKVIAATGGLGSSKTHGAVLKHFMLCLINQDSRLSAFAEPIYSKIGDTAIPTFRKVLTDAGLIEGEHFSFVRGQPRPTLYLSFLNQEVHFITANRPDMIIGAEYSHGTIDEAGDCPREAFQNLRARLRCKAAKVRQLVVVGSPQGINWFADEFDSETQDDWQKIDERDWVHAEKRYRRLRLLTEENPYLPDDYVEELKRAFAHNKALLKAYLYGIFCPLYEGTAFPDFTEERHLKEVEPDRYRDIYLSFDFNAHPLAWVAMQIVPLEDDYGREPRYCFVQEGHDRNTLLSDAVIDFVQKFPVKEYHNTRIFVYGDRSGHAKSHKVMGSDFDILAKELRQFYTNVEIRASRRVAPEIESVEAVNRALSYDRMVVHPRCKNLIRGYQATRWQDGVRKLHKPAGETHTHWPDASKYLVWQLDYLDKLKLENRRRGTVI